MSTELEGVAGAQARGGLESVTRHEELVRLLAEQFARADVSLRELQARADRAGGTRLPRATCADMLAGRRFPKKAVMVAFLRGCRVPEHRLPAWERAWERVRVARLAAMAARAQAEAQAQLSALATVASPLRVTPAATVERDEAAPQDEPEAAAQAGGTCVDTSPGKERARGRSLGVAVLASLAAAILGLLVGTWLPHRTTPEPPTIADDGRAFGPGGSSRFTVTVHPSNTGVRLTRRLDAGIGEQHATITVNGTQAATWRPLPARETYRWQDQTAELPPSLTTGRGSLTVVNTFVSSEQDFNEFRYVVEQRINGRWRTADTLDVGPRHLAGEAAHGYAITGPQTFADVREFAYPPRRS
ncbi:hypothetical protein FXF51_55720 [Nonomuraea sp. PA05]|uniref:hypothetical protein n=1 Tax=Nonomuraea sp. PA05 TaxID=2604466 RepID=UPI0011DB417F|nr:hypothetical protein [Nonomuraea sp. PA05]TYB50643.1 hypothetical protein FXF51_55720 [Nonomuraea sp. PA05]